MGKLNINNQETNGSDFFCPQHSADFTKQSTFKSGENCALTNSDSINSFLNPFVGGGKHASHFKEVVPGALGTATSSLTEFI